MSRQRIASIALAVIALFMLPVGLQATFAPRSFYDDFPLGRHWVALEGGPYNEHLVRDVGGLFLALILATALTLWRRFPTLAIAAAWLLQGTLHVVYHAGHLDGYETVDKVAMIVSLAFVPVLAAVALWAGGTSSARERE